MQPKKGSRLCQLCRSFKPEAEVIKAEGLLICKDLDSCLEQVLLKQQSKRDLKNERQNRARWNAMKELS
jgi:hypothetical protein